MGREVRSQGQLLASIKVLKAYDNRTHPDYLVLTGMGSQFIQERRYELTAYLENASISTPSFVEYGKPIGKVQSVQLSQMLRRERIFVRYSKFAYFAHVNGCDD
jgi:hypothetical protein